MVEALDLVGVSLIRIFDPFDPVVVGEVGVDVVWSGGWVARPVGHMWQRIFTRSADVSQKNIQNAMHV